MKRFILLITAILFLLILSPTVQAAEEGKFQSARKKANEEINKHYSIPEYFKMFNYDKIPINQNRWEEKERHLFVYGEPYGDTKTTGEGIRYRYIGKTMSGEDFTNPHFPHDEWSIGLKLESFRLYREPWNETELQEYKVLGKELRIIYNHFNGNQLYLPSIQRGLEKFWADAIIGKDHPMWNQWHEYVHILQPPTQMAWGLGVAFHKDSRGIIWYVPIPLVPLVDISIPDLSTTLEAESFTNVNHGDKITSTVTYKLNADHPKEETARLRLHHVVDGVEYEVKLEPLNPLDAHDEKGIIKFSPGQSRTYKYNFTVQNQSTKILSRINPVSTDQDNVWENNRDEAQVVSPAYDVKIELTSDKYTLIRLSNGGGDSAEVTALITRKDDMPGDLPVTLTLYLGNTLTFPVTLGPGGSQSIPIPFASWDTATLIGGVWPDGKEDAYPPDNVDSLTITVNELAIPQEDTGIKSILIDSTKFR